MKISDSERAIIDNILNKFVSEANEILKEEDQTKVQLIEQIKRDREEATSNWSTNTNSDSEFPTSSGWDDDEDDIAGDTINTPYFINNVLYDNPKMDFSQFHIATGATRAVLVLKNLPYVIKFDFSNEPGHCDNEVDVYNSAVDYGIQMLLAEGSFYSEVGGINFYIYKKVEKEACKSPYMGKNSEEFNKQVWSVESSGKHCIAGNLTRDIYFAYDLTVFVNLCRFIDDLGLNDFHGSNYGFDGNKPVIFDYGGFEPARMNAKRRD